MRNCTKIVKDMGKRSKWEFKKIEKFQGKVIRIINVLPLNATVEKQVYEIDILKLKDFIMLQNILFVKLPEKGTQFFWGRGGVGGGGGSCDPHRNYSFIIIYHMKKSSISNLELLLIKFA